MTCNNCKKVLGCGCQVRKASNGASVCTTCIAQFEAQLKNNVIRTDNSPQNVNIFYNPPK